MGSSLTKLIYLSCQITSLTVIKMKFFILLTVLVAVVSSFPQGFRSSQGSQGFQSSQGSQGSQGFQSGITNVRSGRSHAGPAARTAPVTAATGNPYGPKAYGPGLNNPYAFPPNQFQVQRALSLANAQQGLLVRVDVNGEVDLTDQFGREVDVYDRFGNDLSDLYDL